MLPLIGSWSSLILAGKKVEGPLCRMCNEKGETVQHIVSECKKLAQRECKRRHDNVAKFVHWKLCENFHLGRTDKWYENAPKGSVENENVKLLFGHEHSM